MIWSRSPYAIPCSRPRKDGSPCSGTAVGWPSWGGLDYVPPHPNPRVCVAHLTKGERTALAEVRTDHQAWLAARDEEREPDCWSWSVPDVSHLPDPEGLTGEALEQYEDAAWAIWISWHQNQCAMCGSGGPHVTDHDHDTGLIRGRLCSGCNITEGKSYNAQIRKYRERHPAAILGIRVRYCHPIYGYAEPAPPKPSLDEVAAVVYRIAEALAD